MIWSDFRQYHWKWVCCSVVYCVAVCCSEVTNKDFSSAVASERDSRWMHQNSDNIAETECVAAWCSVLQCVAECCAVDQNETGCVAVCCSAAQRVAVCCSVVAVRWQKGHYRHFQWSPAITNFKIFIYYKDKPLRFLLFEFDRDKKCAVSVQSAPVLPKFWFQCIFTK